MSSELVVLEAGDLQQLNVLHQGSTRLKVLCFDLCPSLILLGANSGTIYILDHESLTLKTQIPTGSASVVQLSISSDESLVVYALSSGIVQVFELSDVGSSVSGVGGGRGVVMVSKEHEGQEVTAVAWEGTNSEVYIADASGRVSVLYVTRSKTASLFRNPSVHLMTLESAVSQLDYSEGYLLVSTLTRSYICNTALETFAQVGTKLRQGEYGGCFCSMAPAGALAASTSNSPAHRRFYESLEETCSLETSMSERFGLSECFEATEEAAANESNKKVTEKTKNVTPGELNSRIFCSRPGTRIWEADHSGKVLVTHQLKKALIVPPTNVLYTDGSFGEQELVEELKELLDSDAEDSPYHSLEDTREHKLSGKCEDGKPREGSAAPRHPPISVAFTKMLSFYSNYLLAISAYGLYIIDPSNSKVLLWINVSDSVTDVKVSGNSLIYRTSSGCIKNFMVTTIDVAILYLHTRSLSVECTYLCLQYKELFRSSELLCRLGEKILTDLLSSIKNEAIRGRINKLKVSCNLRKQKEQGRTSVPLKPRLTCVRNETFENEELKDLLKLALKTEPEKCLFNRCFSEPQLRSVLSESEVTKRGVVSVENSPVHYKVRDGYGGSTSTYLCQASRAASFNQFSSDDTLQSQSVEHLPTGIKFVKLSTRDFKEGKQRDKQSFSSRSVSQESDSKSSLKSFENSLDLYEDPLFPSDDSSPDPEVVARALYSEHPSNAYSGHNFYNLAYAPIHPGSEAATKLQEMVENVTTNMVGTITSGTKTLTEKFRSVTPLVSSEEKMSKKSFDGPMLVSKDLRANTASPETDGTDDLENVVVQSKSRKKYRAINSGSTPLPNKSPCTPYGDETLRPNQELPSVVRTLHELVTATVEQIISADDKLATYSLLTHWLEMYCHTIQRIQLNKRLSPQASEDVSGDGPVSLSSVDSGGSGGTSCDSLYWDSNDIGFESSAMSADSQEQITDMFLQCLQAGVYIVGLPSPRASQENQKEDLQHSATPEEIKNHDLLYAQLISNDCGLLQYSYLLNALDTLGDNYYVLTWVALLEKITKDVDIAHSHTLPDIIPDLDFTRSQRVSLLYKLSLTGNMKKLVTSAAQIMDPNVVQDLIFMLKYIAFSSETGITIKLDISKLLLQYLYEHFQIKNVLQSYLDWWLVCGELQVDILAATLCKGDPNLYSCECGLPRPKIRPVALDALTHTMLTHRLVYPDRMAALCHQAGYWEGYCTINFYYNLQTYREHFQYVLQACNPTLLEDFIEAAEPEHYPALLDTLAMITCKDPSMMKCSGCRNEILFSEKDEIQNDQADSESILLVNGTRCEEHIECGEWCKEEDSVYTEREGSAVNTGGCENKTNAVKVGGCKREDNGGVQTLPNMMVVWEAVVGELLRLCGSAGTLTLITHVQDNIPPGILSHRVYQWCILVSLAERRGDGVRLALIRTLNNTTLRPYSIKVARSLFRQSPESKPNAESVSGPGVTQESEALSPPPQLSRSSSLSHHWGVGTGVLGGLCLCCHLPLATPALVSEGGITVFPCTHAFHAVCLSHTPYCCFICGQYSHT